MLKFKLMPILLSLFDGGADGGADGNGNGQSFSNSATPTKKGGEYENVVFGKQEATAGANENAPGTASVTPEQRKADFDAFIEQNKDLYDAKFKEGYTKQFEKDFNRRFKDHKDLESRFSQADEIVSLIAQKYGVNDIEALKAKIESDDRLVAERAEENGITPEQQRTIDNLKAQAEMHKRKAEMLYGQQMADRQYQKWAIEAEGLKMTYPEFDLQTESENPDFMRLLKSGVPMEHAYRVIHLNDMIMGNAQAVAQQTAKAVADDIRARGSRPKENAGSATPGVIYKSDVSKLTKKDRAEIAKRAARGEIISF